MGLTDAGQEPNATRQANCGAELRPQQICFGLRSDAVSFYASENFEVLCRVVDSKFGHVSAELLFELRAAASNAIAVQAFESLVGPEAAHSFEQAVRPQVGRAQYHDFGDVVMADATLAKTLLAKAEKLDAVLGGLYQGRLDHLRSTLCNPDFGLNASGCCAACCAIRKSATFVRRLHVSRMAGRASAGASAPSSRTNKRVLSIDEARVASQVCSSHCPFASPILTRAFYGCMDCVGSTNVLTSNPSIHPYYILTTVRLHVYVFRLGTDASVCTLWYRDVFCIGMYWDVSGCIGMYFVSRIVWVSLY